MSPVKNLKLVNNPPARWEALQVLKRAESVRRDGTLVIRRQDGTKVDINVGDVTLRT